MIPQTKRRIQLFNDVSNINKKINLKDSVYNYSYLYIEGEQDIFYVVVPIYSKYQRNFRGIGGWSGTSSPNIGTTAITGDISTDGKTLTINGFFSVVHNSEGNHAKSIERFCKRIVGIR